MLDFPFHDGLTVQAIRVDYEPGGFTGGTHRHPAGAYVYVIDGSVKFGIGDREPFVLNAGESFYEPPGALHAVSRNASEDVPASLIAFFVLGEGESATVTGDVMRAVRLRAPGGPEQLAVEEADRPRPGPGEALVRVHAAAITRDELQWPVDRLPAIPSYELSGVVEEAGPGVTGVAAGDEVFALTPFDRDGVAADYTALPAELLVARPRTLGHAESAAIPLPALTAWQGLFDHGRLARRRARADPRCRGRRRRVCRAARTRARRARDRDRIGGEPGTGKRARRARGRRCVDASGALNRSTSCSTPWAASACAGPPRCCAPAARLVSVAEQPPDGGEFFTVEPNRDQLTSIARLADAGELRPPRVEVFPLASAREPSRAASNGGTARLCWPWWTPHDHDRRGRDPGQRARP